MKIDERMNKVDEIMSEAEQQQTTMTKADTRQMQVDQVMQQAMAIEREGQVQQLNQQTAMKEQAIGLKQITKAREILAEYKRGKDYADSMIVENDQWYNNRFDLDPSQKGIDRVFRSSWLFNNLTSKHADFMDNYPESTVLPREIGDKDTAKMLSSIIPAIFEQNKFRRVYDRNMWSKVKYGTAVYGVFWDPTALNGLGDIKITKASLLNIFYAPGVEDIQDSPNLFVINIQDNEQLLAMYPQLEGKLGQTAEGETKKFILDDTIDTKDKSCVIEWYYKKADTRGKTKLHYVKFCGDEVLYATENETQIETDGMGNITRQPAAITGLYDHGKYPYVFDVLFPQENRPSGVGYIDKLKDVQEQIDILNNAILINTKQSAVKRWIVSNDTKLNMEEFNDWTVPIVHTTDGSFNENTATEISSSTLPEIVIATVDRKIDELKETGANRDFSNGSTASGVTSGAAIAALQESGNKTSRDMIQQSFDAVEEITSIVIELIRQFYNNDRAFRILGENNQTEFVNFNNSGMVMQPETDIFGMTIGQRLPIFDIKIKAHKQNPFSRVANNQDMINFYSMGFFSPENADQSLACLEMMDMENKERLVEKIEQNGTMFEQIQQLTSIIIPMAQELDAMKGTNYLEQIAQMGVINPEQLQQMPSPDTATAEPKEMADDGIEESGHPTVDKARERIRESTSVR